MIIVPSLAVLHMYDSNRTLCGRFHPSHAYPSLMQSSILRSHTASQLLPDVLWGYLEVPSKERNHLISPHSMTTIVADVKRKYWSRFQAYEALS